MINDMRNTLNGFTLVEVLVTVTIFVLVLAVIANIYVLSQKFYQEGSVEAELLQNGRIILERLARELRQAEEIVTQLPQTSDNPDNPPPSEIEFQDGHRPSPYQALGSDYYYIRYYLPEGSGEMHRQYRVYCFDDCAVCSAYFRWDDTKPENSHQVQTHPCNLEEKAIGEYISGAEFWGAGLINISLLLSLSGKEVNLKTAIFGRNF